MLKEIVKTIYAKLKSPIINPFVSQTRAMAKKECLLLHIVRRYIKRT